VQTVDVIAVCLLGLMVTGMASSRAGSLPQVGSGWSHILCLPWISVLAELARDGGVSVDINVDCAAVIASKLGSYRVVVWQAPSMVTGMASSRAGSLPQVGSGWSQILCLPHISVGAELARDGGVSVDINVDCAAVIASELGSYRVVVWQAP